MEENKFEKQVQQKMDELQIQPSDAVWKKIELQIEKKKSHRWGLIILFLCLSIALSGGYWLWNAGRQRSSEHTIVKNNFKIEPVENMKAQSKINSADKPVNENNNETADIEEVKNHHKKTAKHYQLSSYSKANQKINSEEKTPAAFFKEKKIIAEIKGKAESAIIPVHPSEEKFTDNKYRDSINERITGDSLLNAVVKNKVTGDSDTTKKKKANTTTVKLPKNNKWKFGIVFTGGISGVGNNFLGLVNSPVYAYSNSANQGPGAVTGTTLVSSSVTKSHFSFITGAFAEKNISNKSKFIFGINYKSFNTSINLNDSSGTYSSRYSKDKYINHFNFIEFPVSLKIQIGKGKSIPLSWQAGIVLSELLSSNALQFNPYTGYYYKDNSLFNKTQLGLNTGFFVKLFSKQKNSLLIGPYFYYDATKLASEGLYNKKHFVFTGLHTSIIFGK